MAGQQSFEASEMEHAKPREGEGEEGEEEEEKEEEGVGESGEESESDEEEGGGVFELRRCGGEVLSIVPFVEAEARESHLESSEKSSALQFSGNGLCDGFQSNGVSQISARTELKECVVVSNDKVPISLTTQVPEDQVQNQIQLSSGLRPSSDWSPTSVMQSIQSLPSSMLEKVISSPITNSECMPESVRKNFTTLKSTYVPVLKRSASDGFNWRKYGQKQVKSPRGSRSYYKCTYLECIAKKIECCDHSGHVTEIVYKSQHNHDPPRKISSMRESKLLSSDDPIVRDIEHSRTAENTDPSTSVQEIDQEKSAVSEFERKRKHSISYINGNGDIVVKEEDLNVPEPKRRVKKSNTEHSGSLFKLGKKQKFVVHAAVDVGISGDGYRWRKYGQKMVKGNPYPRNYYRCTSAGCPVRKHIETAVDYPSSAIITYKGIHDHDMPVPKKRHGPPSAPLVAASAPASMNNIQVKKTEILQNQMPSTQWSVDTKGGLTGEALDLGGDKAIESARTLLSMGFEIKPC